MPDQHSLVSRIKALAEALEGSDIEEMDLTERGTRIVIKRALDVGVVAPRAEATATRASQPGALAQPRATEPPVPAPITTIAIIAPLTGVYYGSPSPSSPPYIQVGDTVRAGQVVCIVEAMKVFNEITSEVSGTVDSISAEAGQLVHKGDALVRVRPA